MAQDKIGSVQFDVITGAAHPAGLRAAVRTFARDGIDRHEVIGIGERGPGFRWNGCTKWSNTAADAKTFQDTVEALEGTIVTISDHYGIDYENTLIVSVGALVERAKNIRDGNERYRVVANVEMQKV